MQAREVIEQEVERDRPPHLPLGYDDEEALAARQPFTAHELALRRGRHSPRLWQKVRGSVYEPEYRRRFNPQD